MGQQKNKQKIKSSSSVTKQTTTAVQNQKTSTPKVGISNKGKITKPAKLDTKRLLLPGFILVTISFLVFSPSLSLQFVNWDDTINLLDNTDLKAFAHTWNWKDVKEIFFSDVMGGYNPLSIFTYAVEKYFFAPNPEEAPFIFHFNNVLLHVVCTVLVFFLFIQLGLGKFAALFGALLFGIHPMRVESVAWVTERKDVLYGMFFLAALLTYIRYIKSDSSKSNWYLLTLVLSVFSYFAKIQAVALPLSMVAIDFYFGRKWLSTRLLILEKLPFWILSLTFGLINVYFLTENRIIIDQQGVNYSFLERLVIGAYTYVTYIAKWIFPYKLSPLYEYPPTLPTGAYLSLIFAPIAVIAIFIWGLKNNKRNIVFGLAFFTLNIIFLLQIVGAGQAYMADRFTYIAYIGLFFLSAVAFAWALKYKSVWSKLIYSASVVYLTILGFMTIKQISIWENSATLWEYTKKHYPQSPTVWRNAGQYYADKEKNYSKALENYSEALKYTSKKWDIYNSIGMAYLNQMQLHSVATEDGRQKRMELANAAAENFAEAVREDSINGRRMPQTSGEYLVNLGAAYTALGQFDKAKAALDTGLEINPTFKNGYGIRAALFLRSRNYDLAIQEFNKLLAIDRFDPEAYYQRGLCKKRLGDEKSALMDFDIAIALNPDKSSYFLERSKSRKSLGGITGSRQDAMKAQQLGAQVPSDLF